MDTQQIQDGVVMSLDSIPGLTLPELTEEMRTVPQASVYEALRTLEDDGHLMPKLNRRNEKTYYLKSPILGPVEGD